MQEIAMIRASVRTSFKTEPGDAFLSIAIIVALFHALFYNTVFVVFERFQLPGSNIAKGIVYLLEGIILLFALLKTFQRKPKLTIILFLGIGILYLLTSIIYPENTPILLGTVKRTFLICIPLLLMACALNNKELLWNYLLSSRYILMGLCIIYAACARIEGYSMWLGYNMLVPAMMTVCLIYKKKVKRIDYISLLLMVTIIVIKGSRGPILVFGIYVIVGFFIYRCIGNGKAIANKGKDIAHLAGTYRLNALAFAGMGMILLIIIFLNIRDITSWLYELLLQQGIDVRTLRIFSSEGGLVYSSGRDLIYKHVITAIERKPLLGYGLGGDCVSIGRAIYNVRPEEAMGMYAHNLVLAILMHFGIVVGSVLVLLFLWLLIKKWWSFQYEQAGKDLFLIIAIYALIATMISGNYLDSNILWLLVGLALPNTANLHARYPLD